MSKEGKQNPEEQKITRLPKEINLEQKRNPYDSVIEILTSPQFINFVKGKLDLEPNQHLNKIENKDKVLLYENLLAYFSEFLEAKSKVDVKKADFCQLENRHSSNSIRLIDYFSELLKISIDKINKLSPEDLYALKQFLKEKYLSATDVTRILEGTDFKAANKNVRSRVIKLHNLGLIEETLPSGGRYIDGFHSGSEYYNLTSPGLFFALKEIQEEDIGNPFMTESNLGRKIFEIYKEDSLFQLFLYEFVDKNLFLHLSNFRIKWIFIRYIKQVCQEIYKELEFFVDFQKNGNSVEFEVKWNHNLENKKADWNRFFDNLLCYIIPLPAIDYKVSNLSELIVNPHISKDLCSFYYDGVKYSIKIDTKNKSARLCINDNEYFKIFDKEKKEDVYKKHCEISVQIKPHCYILNRVSRDTYVYLMYSIRRFFVPIKSLKTQLCISILQLFKEYELLQSDQFSTLNSKKKLTELRKIASDLNIKRLVADFYSEINKNYQTFVKSSELNNDF